MAPAAVFVSKRYRTCGFAHQTCVTKDGQRIVDAKGRVSRVTTAGAAPSLGKYLLLAYLTPEHAVEGNELRVMYMNETYPVRVARVGSKPLFDPDDARAAQREAWARWRAIDPERAAVTAPFVEILDITWQGPDRLGVHDVSSVGGQKVSELQGVFVRSR